MTNVAINVYRNNDNKSNDKEKNDNKKEIPWIKEMETLANQKAVYSLLFFQVVLLLLWAGPVRAADEVDARSDAFFGADVVYNVLNIEAANTDFSPITARLRLGIDIFPDIIPSIALETHFMFDLTEDEQDVGGQTAAIKIDHAVALLARPYFELSDSIILYGLVGFTAVQIEGGDAITAEDTESGFSIGVGGQFALPFDINGNVEAIQAITGDEVDLFSLSFGISIPL